MSNDTTAITKEQNKPPAQPAATEETPELDDGFVDDIPEKPDDLHTSHDPSDEDAAPQKKRTSFGRAFVVLFAILLIALNIWAFIDILRADLLVISVELDNNQISLFENEANTLFADVRSYGLSETLGLSQAQVEWSSSAPEVASVSSDGTIQANSSGTAIISAIESRSGISSSCTVTVYDLTDILLNIQSQPLGVGESFALEASLSGSQLDRQLSYESSSSSVASVDENGNVTALSTGEAVITVSARGYTPAECAVTVFAEPTAIVTEGIITDICLGETRKLEPGCAEGEYCSQFTIRSSDPSVISINENGSIVANEKGTATVTIATYNGISVDLQFNVAGEPKSVDLERSRLSLYSGYSYTLTPEDSTGCCKEYYYSSSDQNVAQVDENGVITAFGHGQATITCSSYNGKSDTLTVNVTIVDYTTPYTSDVVYRNIEALLASYPELISTESIGTSVLGKDIPLIKIGTGERKAIVVAGLHSREGISVTFTMRCIEEYAEAYYSKSGKYGSYNVKEMLDKFTLYIVPLMNPDGLDIVNTELEPVYDGFTLEGFERAKYKNNANGVNLNRNFPFMWGYSDDKNVINITNPDTLSYAGESAGSEPETQAIMKVCNENEFEWLLDVHCRGNIMYYQDQYNEVTSADNRLASLLARRCGFTLQDKSTAYEISGGLENWFRAEFGKPGICIELVKPEFSYVVNGRFEDKLNWSKTRYAFLMGMID